MKSNSRSAWTTPTLEVVDMASTAVKGEGPNESGQTACGPGQATVNCS